MRWLVLLCAQQNQKPAKGFAQKSVPGGGRGAKGIRSPADGCCNHRAIDSRTCKEHEHQQQEQSGMTHLEKSLSLSLLGKILLTKRFEDWDKD